MDNIKNYFVVGVVLLVVAIAGIVYPRPVPVVDNVRSITDRVDEWMETRLGAIPGTTIDSRIVTIGGVDIGYIGQPITATSSALCSLRNPFSSTSTIDKLTIRRTSGFEAATTFDISTSTSAFGSSTVALVKAKLVAAGSQDTTVWSPRHATTSVGAQFAQADTLFWADYAKDSPYILRGSEFVTFRNATSSAGNETVRGYCNGEFIKL